MSEPRSPRAMMQYLQARAISLPLLALALRRGLLLCLPRKLGNVKSVVSASPRGYPAEAPERIIALQRPNQVFVPRATTRADVILVALLPPAPIGCPPEGPHVLHEREKPL